MYSSIDVSPLVANCMDLAMERADEICSSRNIELAADWVALVAAQMQAHAVLHTGEALSKGFGELAAAFEIASDELASAINEAAQCMGDKLGGIDSELDAGNRELLGGMRGIEEALRTFQSCKGKSCLPGM
jgi:hypothetical protein